MYSHQVYLLMDLGYSFHLREDKTLYKLRDIDVEDAIEILRGKGRYDDYSSPKAIICELLGFYNSWSVSYEEACIELKKLF